MAGDRIEQVNSPSTSTENTQIEVRPVESIPFFETYYQNLIITSGSVGIDLRAYLPFETEFDPFIIPSGKSRIIPTDIKFKFPPRLYGLIKDRSSMAAKGLVTRGGVIDNDYTGEIKVILFNTGFDTQIHHGDKIAQLIIMKYPKYQLKRNPTTNQFPKTERGDKGFGQAEWTDEEKEKWIKRQLQWQNSDKTNALLELTKKQTLKEWLEFQKEHDLDLIPPWFADEQGEIQHDIGLHDAQQEQIKQINENIQKELFKEFNEKAEMENESNLLKRKFSVDLDISSSDEEQDDAKWDQLKKILKADQISDKAKMEKERIEKLQERDAEYRKKMQQPIPSTSTAPPIQYQVINENQGTSWKTWKEEKIKSGTWIEDVEEYKRQQEAKGLMKRTFKTKDGKFFSKWVKKPRLE